MFMIDLELSVAVIRSYRLFSVCYLYNYYIRTDVGHHAVSLLHRLGWCAVPPWEFKLPLRTMKL